MVNWRAHMINHIQLLLAYSSGQDLMAWVLENSENFRRADNGMLLEHKPNDRIPCDCYIYGDIGYGFMEYPL